MRPDHPQAVRRSLIVAALGLALGGVAGSAWATDAASRLAALEARLQGRLGLAALDTGSGRSLNYRADERFVMCSTFKTLAVAAVLARVDRGQDSLERRITFGKAQLLSHAPVTAARVGEGGMSLGELCAAMIEQSDNTAANLVLARLGGPAAVTAYVRGLGDPTTRLDRIELELNKAAPGDLRDTTTPAAMIADWRALLLQNALSPASRTQLGQWLAACQTGPDRLPLAKPKGWAIAHKTGTGDSVGDVAMFTPPTGAPILICVYVTDTKATTEACSAAIAQAGRIALAALKPTA